MQLILQVRNTSACINWCEYALLRDNVEHYLESGSGRDSFTALHGLERAVDGDVGSLDALDLRSEVERAWAALGNLTLAESAISLRTRAILTGCASTPLVRGTVLARLSGWQLPIAGDERQPLRDCLTGFVESVLLVTAAATPTDDIYVKRQPQPS